LNRDVSIESAYQSAMNHGSRSHTLLHTDGCIMLILSDTVDLELH
jgi:hypothetical protein